MQSNKQFTYLQRLCMAIIQWEDHSAGFIENNKTHHKEKKQI